MGYSKTRDDEPTDLYESTSQTSWRHDHSAAVEEAYWQRYLTETDGREFGPPDDELSATACHRCGRDPDPGSGPQYEHAYGYRQLCCACFEEVCAEEATAEAEDKRQDNLRLLVEERAVLRLRLAELDEAIAATQGEAPSADILRLESGATIALSGPSGPPWVGSEHHLLVWANEEGEGETEGEQDR